jgi:hypothetical protein
MSPLEKLWLNNRLSYYVVLLLFGICWLEIIILKPDYDEYLGLSLMAAAGLPFIFLLRALTLHELSCDLEGRKPRWMWAMRLYVYIVCILALSFTGSLVLASFIPVFRSEGAIALRVGTVAFDVLWLLLLALLFQLRGMRKIIRKEMLSYMEGALKVHFLILIPLSAVSFFLFIFIFVAGGIAKP